MLECPQCSSKFLYKDGLRHLVSGEKVQRWLCRSCGYRFSKTQNRINWMTNIGNGEYKLEGSDPSVKSSLQALIALTQTLEKENRQAGATQTQQDFKGRILEFAWWLKQQGYRESTILGYVAVMKSMMNKGANLLDPQSVKETIAKQDQWSIGRKAVAAKAYTTFLRKLGLNWQKPIYEAPRKLPLIPLEREIDDLIASSNQHIAAFLRIAKETGARAGEIYSLKWLDIDFERQTIRITAEKNSNPRIFRISNLLAAMLIKLPKDNECIFHYYRTLNNLRRSFQRYRKKAAFNLGNPRLNQITFHTLRHWKATMEYAKTKDILYVMQVLGHRNIKNTLIYTQLVKNISEDEYTCKIAKTPSEIQELIEAGFEHVCQNEELMFFRKRK